MNKFATVLLVLLAIEIPVYCLTPVVQQAMGPAPLQVAAPPDVLTSQAAAASALTAYKSWVENAITSHDSSIQSLWNGQQASETAIAALQNQVAAIPAGPQGPQGIAGPSLNAPQVDSTAIVASNPPATLVRTLCYPANAYVGTVPATGESLDFTVNAGTAGNYAITACVATPNAGKTYHVEFPAGTKVGASVTAVNTGGYQVFAYQATGVTLALPAGQSTVRVVLENGGMNFAGFNFK
ncbi:MAG: hypothetical protein NVS9B14_06730 [Candidatus Acidiferrum sp.]